MAVPGHLILIFTVLLSGYPASELTAVSWHSTVLHYIVPIASVVLAVLTWVIASVPRGRPAAFVRPT